MTPKGSAALFRMLADVAEDPKKLEQFKDPEKRRELFGEYDLDEEQIDLLNKALDEKRHDLERYGHMAKLVGDAAEKALVPLC